VAAIFLEYRLKVIYVLCLSTGSGRDSVTKYSGYSWTGGHFR